MQTLKELPKALIKARQAFKPIIENEPGHNYKYATLKELFDKTQLFLWQNNLFVVQTPISNGNLIGMRTEIWHESGEMIGYEFCVDLDVKNVGPMKGIQAVGSLITYLKRYHYAAVLGLIGEDDDDGQKAKEEFHKEAKQQPSEGGKVLAAVSKEKPKTEAVKDLKETEQVKKLLADIKIIMNDLGVEKLKEFLDKEQLSVNSFLNLSADELRSIKERMINAK